MKLKVIDTGSDGNCFLLKPNNGHAMLIECGARSWEVMKKGLNYKFDNICACLISHEHKDHCVHAERLTNYGIELFSTFETLQFIRVSNQTAIKPGRQFEICNFKIVSFEIIHDAFNPVGFLINHPECGTICFATDTRDLSYDFPNVDHWIIEANYSEPKMRDNIEHEILNGFLANRIYNNHMSIETTCKVLKKNASIRTKTVTLIHMSEDNGDEKEFEKMVMSAIGIKPVVAKKGTIVELFK